jgi:transposase
MIEKQLDELFPELTLNKNSRARKKCLMVYLRKKGYQREEVAELLRIDEDTVTNYTKKYDESGLQGLLEENYHHTKSQLEPYTEQLKELFNKQVPHTVNQAIEMIDKETGICLKPSACREFLRKIGMKCRRCGVVPGKAMDDDKQRKAQQEFHDKQLQSTLDEAKQGKRTVLFVDAAHFVMGAFLGMVWCFVRLLLPSASGRKRHNVLGAYDPIKHEAITITNDTYINQDVFCEFLDKIANVYTSSGRPITLILDNARYQKCQSVAKKAKELNIELLYLPPYSPNLNLIERLWRFVKKQVLYSKHYDRFDTFRNSINTCISDLGTRFKNEMQSLMTMNFQLF